MTDNQHSMTKRRRSTTHIRLSTGEIVPITKEVNFAAEAIAAEMSNFISYLQKRWPELDRVEATCFATAITGSLPSLFESHPELTELLDREIPAIKARVRNRNKS